MSELTHSKQSGEFETHGWYGELERGATVSCVHCQATWMLQKGSGRLRGWCMTCNGFVCGPNCMECVPIMRKVENEEAGKPADFVPIQIFVPPGIDDVAGE
jgi:hypothetical protein